MVPLVLPVALAMLASVCILVLLTRWLRRQPKLTRYSRSLFCGFPALLLLLEGCTSVPAAPCDSLSCWQQAAVEPIYQGCMTDLQQHDRLGALERRRIDETYRYPLTNATTYFSLLSGGGRVVSPGAWCRSYADQFAQVSFADSTAPAGPAG